MKYLTLLIVILSMAACQTPTASNSPFRPPLPPKATTFTGGNGSSYSNAIIVHASDEGSGVHAEYDYIKAHYPGYHFISQGLSSEHGKSYDVMTFADAHGKKHVLYFDISEYFGRM